MRRDWRRSGDEPQSAPPISFTVSATGDYKIEIVQLYGKQRGDAIMHVRE